MKDCSRASGFPPVIHVVRQYAPAVGGLENFVKALAEQQVRMGLDVTVITLNRGFSDNTIYPDTETINGVRVVRIPFFGSKRYPLAPSVLRHIKAGSLVHVHCTDFFSDFLAFTRPIHRATLVLSTHGGFFHTKFAGKLKTVFFNLITRLSLKAYKRVFACSIGDMDRFSAITHNIELIENGVDVDRFQLKGTRTVPGSPQFLYVGRFSSNKRIDNLIHIFSQVIPQFPDSGLLIVGNDYDGLGEGYKQLIEGYGLTGRIQLVSGVSDSDLVKLVEQSQYVVSASEYEGFGMTIIEGMAGGLIPVVNNIPSFNKIVTDSGLGLICNFEHKESAESIVGFIKSKNTAQQSTEAVAFASRYSWNGIERKFFDAYERALGLRQMDIQGITISNVTGDEAIATIQSQMDERMVKLAFANAHTINVANDDPEVKALLKDFMVLPDGIGVDIAAKIKFGHKFIENLNGTDFTPELLKNLRPARIYLLGGQPGVADKALQMLSQQYPQHTWVGCHHGYIDHDDSKEIQQEIARQNIDIVLVAMGNPLQEQWIQTYAEGAGVKLAVGVGAFLDFTAGKVKRAPQWVRNMRLEWIYRLLIEPKRMWKRYLVGNVVFLLRSKVSS